MKIDKLFGQRVAVELVDEEYTGLLVTAPTEQRMHMLSKVIATGDKTKWAKVGDTVFWQWNATIEAMCKYSCNGKPFFMLHEGDLIARLASRRITLESFEVLGEWCLVRREIEEKVGRIFIPGQVADSPASTLVRHFLVQKGAGVDFEIGLGEELIVDRGRANPLQIDNKEFCYVQKPFVLGTYA